MIKGWQINATKKGAIQLILHRDMDCLAAHDVDDWTEWNNWFRKQERTYKIEQTAKWWTEVWPTVKGAVNLALHKNESEVVIDRLRVWIRIGEDISIGFYSFDIDKHPSPNPVRNPLHPGCLVGTARIPIEWWNEKIDDVTDEINWMAKLKT